VEDEGIAEVAALHNEVVGGTTRAISPVMRTEDEATQVVEHLWRLEREQAAS
jgi:hypothetical protein